MAPSASDEGKSKQTTTEKRHHPEFDQVALREYAAWLKANPDKKFVNEVSGWARILLDETDLPRTAIALEMMTIALSAFDEGFTHAEIADAYPVEAWRKDTVEVPRAWIRELVDCWRTYKDAPTGTDFGEAFKIDGQGQGRRPVRSDFEAFAKVGRRRNEVVIEYLMARAAGQRPSWNAAIAKVAIAEGVSTDTVKGAMDESRDRILAYLRKIGILN
jgi:hypothetical protein